MPPYVSYMYMYVSSFHFPQPSLLHLHPHFLSYTVLTYLRCQDYILIDRGQFGTTELCGNITLESEFGSLEEGKFTIFFRSSETTRGRGFRMFVVCFKPEERDQPGDLYRCAVHKCHKFVNIISISTSCFITPFRLL